MSSQDESNSIADENESNYISESGSEDDSGSNGCHTISEDSEGSDASSYDTVENYESYQKNKISFTHFIDGLSKDTLLYNKKDNTVYKVEEIDTKIEGYPVVNVKEKIVKEKKKEDKKKKDKKKKEEDDTKSQEEHESKKKKKKHNKKNNEDNVKVKEEEKVEKKKQKITIDNYFSYTLFRKAKIYYVNYLNKTSTLYFPVNINLSFDSLIQSVKKNYNVKSENITLIFHNEKIKTPSQFLFTPKNFNFEKDYIILIETEDKKESKFTLQNEVNTEIFSKSQMNHLVIPSNSYNISFTSITVSKEINTLNLEIYKLPYCEISASFCSSSIVSKAKELFNSNWKTKAEMVYSMKTSISRMNSIAYRIIGKEFSLTNINLERNVPYVISILIPEGKCSYQKEKSRDSQGFHFVPDKGKTIIYELKYNSISDFAFNNK